MAAAGPPRSGAPGCAPGAARSPTSAPGAGEAPVARVVVPAIGVGAEAGGLGRRTKTLPKRPDGTYDVGGTAGTTRPQEMTAGKSRGVEPDRGTEPRPPG